MVSEKSFFFLAESFYDFLSSYFYILEWVLLLVSIRV